MEWQNERVLVTGAGGVLGSALLPQLRALRVAALLAPDRAECDLMDIKMVLRTFEAFRPTLVIHLAGRVSGVQGNITFSGLTYRDNSLINLHVIDAARLAGARKVIAAGTVAVYPDRNDRAITESDLFNGRPHGSEGAYAHAKLGMLSQLEAYQKQWGLDYAYLLYTNLYGPQDRFDEQYGHVVPSLVSRFERMLREEASEIVIWGDGSPTRDFLFAEDAASATIASAEHLSGPVNVASGQSVPIRRLVEALQSISGFQGRLVWDTTKPLGQLIRSYDVSRLFATGWRPRYGLIEGLQATWDWYRGASYIRR